jgi:sulfite reductase (NADPH) flavoprotein alpha-component
MPNEQTLRPTAAPSRSPQVRALAWPWLRTIWFRLHWFVGITAGTVLTIIGLTGATLAFRDELIDALDPGVRHVAVRDVPTLAPADVVAAIARVRPDARIAQVTIDATPGAAVRIAFAPVPGERRGAVVYVDPYTGALQPALRAADFFEWVEQLHRWLLLPREIGKPVTGALAACLLFMALSGLYLRWPRRMFAWRSWFAFDVSRRGRLFLRGLHALLGTFALVVYLVSTSTGLYWGFDAVKDSVDGWLGANVRLEGGRSPRTEGGREVAGPLDLARVWTAFVQRAGAWQLASLRLPDRASQPIQVVWLAQDAPHDRARSRMDLRADTGEVVRDVRYADQPRGDRLVSLVYPLHTGTALGLPGRIAITMAALLLPVFAVTGWAMYLLRRRRSSRR